ncbi:MAG: DUF1570 domain-containing protein [Thermoguttaceae bacterium]
MRLNTLRPLQTWAGLWYYIVNSSRRNRRFDHNFVNRVQMTIKNRIQAPFFRLLLLSLLTVVFLSLVGTISPVQADEYPVQRLEVHRKDGAIVELHGQVLVEGTEGEIALRTRDGQIHLLHQREIRKRWMLETPFLPFTKDEMVDSLREELGEQFSIHTTDHYIIVYSTSDTYAQWCGTLFEKLYSKYKAIWKRKGLPIEEPIFPLVVIIFPNKIAFDQYAREKLHSNFPPNMLACYHLLTNQILLCDLTGTETTRENTGKKLTSSQIREIMNRPGSGYNVSALLHEAAHQIGYNNGMFERLAPVPRWLLEGIAMLHEPAELENVKKELDDPKVNKLRLKQFIEFRDKQPADAIRNLIYDDAAILKPNVAIDYYGLSWAVTYYLLKKRNKDLGEYLRVIGEKKIGGPDSSRQRLDEFELIFGGNWEKFYRDFARFANSITK